MCVHVYVPLFISGMGVISKFDNHDQKLNLWAYSLLGLCVLILGDSLPIDGASRLQTSQEQNLKPMQLRLK